MNFQGMQKIENSKFYLDLAFSRAKKDADEKRKEKFETALKKAIGVESQRLLSIQKSLDKAIKRIIVSFPSFDSMPEFYQELVETIIPKKDAKITLAGLDFARNKIKDLTRHYLKKIKLSQKSPIVNEHRRGYYGRVSSLINGLSNNFIFLDEVRKKMRELPNVKTSLTTICLCGYPNVGKSTLLKKITGSEVKIRSYAFTTTSLLLGYKKIDGKKIQFIDTPGVLNRTKKNSIEHTAYLAVKYLANFCVFVMDLSLHSGYAISAQEKLLSQIEEKMGKEVIIYLSKTDLMEKIPSKWKSMKNVVYDEKELLKIIEEKVEDESFY